MVTRRGQECLYLDKIDFKSKVVIRDEEDYYIMIKKSIYQDDITIVNLQALNLRAPKYIKQILTELKGEIKGNTVIKKELQYPNFNNGQIIQTKSSKETVGAEEHYRSGVPNP